MATVAELTPHLSLRACQKIGKDPHTSLYDGTLFHLQADDDDVMQNTSGFWPIGFEISMNTFKLIIMQRCPGISTDAFYIYFSNGRTYQIIGVHDGSVMALDRREADCYYARIRNNVFARMQRFFYDMFC